MKRNRVRPFERNDNSQVADLHSRAFPDEAVPTSDYFEEFYFRSPFAEPDLGPLVYENADRRVIGFLGVMPRRYCIHARSVRVAVAAKLMVDPAAGSAAAGITLLRKFLAGPQDLSIADRVNPAGRTLWHALRAQTVWPYNFRWICRLRQTPSRAVNAAVAHRPALRRTARAARPLLTVLDAAAERLPGLTCPPRTPRHTHSVIDPSAMIDGLRDTAGRSAMVPSYDRVSLDWLLSRARAKTVHGRLQILGVWDAENALLGWYIYYLKPHAPAPVLQFVARPGSAGDVLDSLLYHAWCGGAAAVTGPVQPHLAPLLSAGRGISCHLPDYWMMVHTEKAELLSVIHRGDALLTPLDGEWSLAYHGEKIARPEMVDGQASRVSLNRTHAETAIDVEKSGLAARLLQQD